MKAFIILYLVGFVRTIVVIAVIYFIIRIFSRYVIPLLFEKKLKDMQNKMQQQQKQQQRSNRNEGEVTIEYDQKNKKGNNGNEGEYVDFEEIE